MLADGSQEEFVSLKQSALLDDVLFDLGFRGLYFLDGFGVDA